MISGRQSNKRQYLNKPIEPSVNKTIIGTPKINSSERNSIKADRYEMHRGSFPIRYRKLTSFSPKYFFISIISKKSLLTTKIPIKKNPNVSLDTGKHFVYQQRLKHTNVDYEIENDKECYSFNTTIVKLPHSIQKTVINSKYKKQ